MPMPTVHSLLVSLLSTACVLALVATARPGLAADRPTLSAEGDPQAGHVTLSWQFERQRPGVTYQLEQAESPRFDGPRVLYEGAQTSSVMSGLPNGSYLFRVRARGPDGSWSAWSPASAFEVSHHSRALAASLFGLGALVFGLTVWKVTRGEERTG
jgi:hypothetical protein